MDWPPPRLVDDPVRSETMTNKSDVVVVVVFVVVIVFVVVDVVRKFLPKDVLPDATWSSRHQMHHL